MATIGFHAAHELYPPSRLLQYLQRAEKVGFTAGSCSDHFHPWSERQGNAGFSWCWLGAALQATSLPLGVICTPGWRYHPAVAAQAVATLLEMFPGRFWMAVGSGEALNERITGAPWPTKPERNARLKEAVEIMRALWSGETVNHNGYYQVKDATLYTRPRTQPMVVGAALTPETAKWFGSWADGLITAGAAHEPLKNVVDAFRSGGGENKPIFLQSALSYADSEEAALQSAHKLWRHAVLNPPDLADLSTPYAFDIATASAQPEELKPRLRISADLQRHIDWIQGDIELGISHIYLSYIGPDMDRFLEAFGQCVLPVFQTQDRQIATPAQGIF